MKFNYKKLGLKVGLELHFQLATKCKLFCQCPVVLTELKPELSFRRRLRPTQSELGEVDPAALFEFRKGLTICYEADSLSTCLVELDEEPPHNLNEEAVDIALTVALMLNANPVDEIHVMRKIVIDGSNTTGFQRTCVIAVGGFVEVRGKHIGIQTVCLEEDAARLVERRGTVVTYRLDRLGIPLIEVSTNPDIESPEEAAETALAIGRIVMSTGKTRKVLGAIRQDINVSIKEGALVEVKGIQRLSLISKVVESEVERQLRLIKLREEIKRRGILKSSFERKLYDVTDVFKSTKCRIIAKALHEGGVVYAVKLPKFKGLLAWNLTGNLKFGTELADYARFWSRLGGIFHTDELPNYGISYEEVKALKEKVCAGEEDAVVIATGFKEDVEDGLRAVLDRVLIAFDGVPEETRRADSNGITRYMRPRPGAARMYPETDIPLLKITEERIKRIRDRLPEIPSRRIDRYVKEYGLSRKLAEQVTESGYERLFEEICERFPSVSPSIVATTFTEIIVMLRRRGIPVNNISAQQFFELFRLLSESKIFKEAIPDILACIAKEKCEVEEAVKKLGLVPLTKGEIAKIITEEVEKHRELIARMGKKASKIILGAIMKKWRGQVDPSKVLEEVEKAIRRINSN